MNAFIFITLFYSIFVMNGMTQADLDEADQAKFFCGSYLNKAMKTFCRPEFREILNRKTKKSFDSENELKVESALEQVIGSFYEDEDFQGDASGYGFDWVANYVKRPHLNKRNSLDRSITITQACCRNPCTLHVLTQFCPVYPRRQ